MKPVKITLIEGSIKVSDRKNSVMVRPGDQAVAEKEKITIHSKVSLDNVMAWKNGFFAFKNANIPSVMKQLSKWYDIDVVYEKEIPDILFSGKLQRKLSLRQIVEVLNTMEVHCTIEGNKLIIKS